MKLWSKKWNIEFFYCIILEEIVIWKIIIWKTSTAMQGIDFLGQQNWKIINISLQNFAIDQSDSSIPESHVIIFFTFFIFPPVCKPLKQSSKTTIGNCSNNIWYYVNTIRHFWCKKITENASVLKMLCMYCRTVPWVAFHVASSNWNAPCIQRVWSRSWQHHQPAGQTGAAKIFEKPRQLAHTVGHRPG